MLKKLIVTCFSLLVVFILISGTIMAATGNIKIIVNGKEVHSDVAPKSENGRVMVPISTISKALGANVQWDSKNRSVVIKSSTAPGQTNIWPDEQDPVRVTQLRDLLALYVASYNTKAGDYQSLVTTRFASDFVDAKLIIPGPTELDRIIDYRIVDMTFNGTLEEPDQFKARVEVIKYSNMVSEKHDIEKLQLDFEFSWNRNQGLAIDGIWVKEKENVASYTMFEGATFKEEK